MSTIDIKEKISAMGHLFAAERLVVDTSITATDRIIF
jgi:hypothetical protein